MHVSSYYATALLVALASLAGVAQAVEFDEKLKAPMVKTGAELKPKLESYTVLMNRLAAKSPLEVVRDQAALRERFDAQFQLGRLVDARAPLPELASLGFEAKADGSYHIDTKEHPEWRPLDSQLLVFANTQVLDGLAPALIARGFRPEDVDAMRRYVSEHNLDRELARAKLAIAVSTSKVAKKYQKLKRSFDEQLMLAYFYQKGIDAAEVQRQWGAALLDALDPQRQRILATVLTEQTGTWFIAPTATDAALQYEREMLLRPDFEQLAKTAFEEGRL
jgi:hypothetical protein